MKLNTALLLALTGAALVIFLTSRCKTAKLEEANKALLERVSGQEYQIDGQVKEIANLTQTVNDLESREPTVITKWVKGETKYIPYEDTEKYDKLQLRLLEAETKCENYKNDLAEARRIIDAYRSTTHYESTAERGGYQFSFTASLSRNEVQEFGFTTNPPLIPSNFKCPEPVNTTHEEPRYRSIGVLLGQNDLFGDRENVVGMTYGKENWDFGVSYGFGDQFTNAKSANVFFNPKIRLKNKK